MNKGVAILLVVGLLQMVGDVLGVGALKGFGAATGASPAPKVFSSAHGLETFSSEFVVEWTDNEGRAQAVKLTPETLFTPSRALQPPQRFWRGACLCARPQWRSSHARNVQIGRSLRAMRPSAFDA